MPKGRKRKLPIVSVETTSSGTPYSSRTLIRQFHGLLKRKAQLEKLPTLDKVVLKALEDVEQQIAELGGLESYQRMSVVGQSNDRGGGSEKFLIQWLKELGVAKKGATKSRCNNIPTSGITE